MSNMQEALHRATSSASTSNYSNIFAGFAEKGISDVRPRENVFTYNAWRALGRQVRKGEHGVKVLTFIEAKEKDKQDPTTGQVKQGRGYRRPWSTTVFHVSQTDPIEERSN